MTAGQRWLYRYSWLLVAATTCLIFIGAMVTSKDAGLAVPDWPLSFGSVNPPGWWKEELVFWEHGHRLVASVIGLLTIGLVLGTWMAYPGNWLRKFAVSLLVLVIIQGIMGGLRVTEKSTVLAIIHGCVAQSFYSLLVVFMVLISPSKVTPKYNVSTAGYSSLRWASAALLASVFIQLIIGAIMRHLNAGLAIIGFPLSNGKWIPDFNNFGIVIHFIHRSWAIVVTLLAIHCLVVALKRFPREPRITRPIIVIVCLIGVQILLGALVVGWLRDMFGIGDPIPTSLHVLNGAAILASGTYFAMRMRMIGAASNQSVDVPGASTIAGTA